jgi:transcriptional regulator with XRE-family HTH domain
MDIKIKIGNRIKDLRASKGMSQTDLAFCSNLARSYIAGVENGKRNISIENIEKITTGLQISVRDFFEEVSFGEIKEIK